MIADFICWLFGHKYPMVWIGNNRRVHMGPCSRCGFGNLLEPREVADLLAIIRDHDNRKQLPSEKQPKTVA